MRTISVTVMVITSKVPFGKLLDISLLKVLVQQLRGILTAPSERHCTVEDFSGMDQDKCKFFLG